MKILPILAATAAIGAIATPALAQNPYPYPYPQSQQQVPQPYPGQPGYGYGQQGYGHANQGGIAGIINQLLGNRYNVTDRQLVAQCATAAQAQAARQYRPARANAYGQPPYGNAYGYYGQAPGYGQQHMARVTAITSVQRRGNGLRVTGLMDSGMSMAQGYGAYGQQGYGQPGYGNQGYHPAYANHADLSFRCNVDNRGVVTGVRLSRTNQHRSQYGR